MPTVGDGRGKRGWWRRRREVEKKGKEEKKWGGGGEVRSWGRLGARRREGEIPGRRGKKEDAQALLRPKLERKKEKGGAIKEKKKNGGKGKRVGNALRRDVGYFLGKGGKEEEVG